MSSFALAGSIPTEFGKLINMRYLHLESNKLSGTPRLLMLPGLVVRVYHFALIPSSFALAGSIPTEFGELINLTDLDLFGNLTDNVRWQAKFRASCSSASTCRASCCPTIDWLVRTAKLAQLILVDKSTTFFKNVLVCAGRVDPHRIRQAHQPVVPSSPRQQIGRYALFAQFTWCGTSLPLALKTSSFALAGSIPTELGELINLNGLSLGDNELSGAPSFAHFTWVGMGVRVYYLLFKRPHFRQGRSHRIRRADQPEYPLSPRQQIEQ
jgi:hypothetical protein